MNSKNNPLNETKIKLSNLMTDREIRTHEYSKYLNDLEKISENTLKSIGIEKKNKEAPTKKEKEYYKELIEKSEIINSYLYK
jgi:hypothetical protein